MKSVMLKAAIAAGVATASFGVAEVAVAGTFFELGDVDVHANQGLGLMIETKERKNLPSFYLEEGESQIFNIFKIWTEEEKVNFDDRFPKLISVAFDFLSPDADPIDFGITGALGKGKKGFGYAAFGKPLEVEFGNHGLFKLDIFDTKFGLDGKKNGAHVKAKVKLIRDSKPDVDVPEPATMLGLGAVAAAGLLAQKRARKEVA